MGWCFQNQLDTGTKLETWHSFIKKTLTFSHRLIVFFFFKKNNANINTCMSEIVRKIPLECGRFSKKRNNFCSQHDVNCVFTSCLCNKSNSYNEIQSTSNKTTPDDATQLWRPLLQLDCSTTVATLCSSHSEVLFWHWSLSWRQHTSCSAPSLSHPLRWASLLTWLPPCSLPPAVMLHTVKVKNDAVAACACGPETSANTV